MANRWPIWFLLITVMIDSIGIGLIMPVMPTLLTEVTGSALTDAAIWGGILSAAFSVMQFLFGPVVGSLSDRYGRRPVLLLSLLIMAVDYLIMAIAGSIWVLLAGRIVGGIAAATHSTAAASMADISAPQDKAANFGLIGAAFGIGFVLGPALGGILGEFGSRAPFYAAAVLALLNTGFGYFVLRETVSDEIRRPFRWARANPFGAFRAIGQLPGLSILLIVFFLYQLSAVVYPAIWSYYTAYRFDWPEWMIGLSLAIFGLSFAIVQGALVAPSIRWFGNRRTVIIGLSLEVLSLLVIGLLTSGLWLLILTPMAALGAVGLPALQGIMSRRVSDDAQGELQGILTSLTSLAYILAYLAMTQVFSAFTGPGAILHFPGAPFFVSALLMTGSLGLFSLSRRRPNS